ncbi:23S rRNA (uracil(1939)-C(5))-methyltransferase RlmD [bacterium]|nr:23S rRNA (uracil(1939)-C(5))-methyltransferase RlmD [bacterium]
MILKNIKIDKIIYKGYGLGTYQGKKVFIPNTYPGDIVDGQLLSEKKDYYKALPVKFHKSEIVRIPARCPVFTECGGCNMLDVDYFQQCELKKQVIEDIYPDYISLINNTIASPKADQYRNKVFFPVTIRDKKIIYGMFKNLSHTVVSADKCRLVSSKILEIAQEVCNHLNNANETVYDERSGKGNIRHLGFRVNSKQEVMVIIVTNKSKLAFTNTLIKTLTNKFPQVLSLIQNINRSNTNTILGDSDKVLLGQPYFFDEIGNKEYKVHYQSFFQVNRQITELIYKQIRADLDFNSNVLDAYSGVSTIGIFIADKANLVVSVENNEWAVQDANYNIKLNKCNNIGVINAKLEDKFEEIIDKYKINTIVFDPPRKGLETNIRDLIKNSKINKIIYLSCNPTTQKRDMQDFCKAGFKLEKMIPYDMFPHTYHIENYALLTR